MQLYAAVPGIRKVGAVWRQLSGFDKFRFVCFVIGLPATVLATTLLAMEHRWVNAAIQAFLFFSFSYYLYKFATRGRGTGEPQLHDDDSTTSAPTVAAPSTSPSPSPDSVGNAVAIALSVAAIFATVVVLFVMWWNVGVDDWWPPGPSNAVPPCLPNIDHHCPP
jgi:hypothetical protein